MRLIYHLNIKHNMLRILTGITICGIIIFNTGCKTTKSSVDVIASWVNKDSITPKKTYSSVFITVLTQNMTVRSSLERDLAAAATANGIKAVQSLAVLTPVTGVADSVILEAFGRMVKKSGCETVLLVSLLDSKSDTKYVPGHNYNPYPYYGYYGTFYGYYAQTYNTISTPGYYETNNTYYIESNLYDVETQGILFSIQTKAVNPDDITKSSQKFTSTLIEEIKRNGFLKKK